MAVSATFVIIKGIEFGDEKCGKWLSSLLISFLSSVLITQPLQVNFQILFFFILLKKF
jgi:hypothetical protein